MATLMKVFQSATPNYLEEASGKIIESAPKLNNKLNELFESFLSSVVVGINFHCLSWAANDIPMGKDI